MTHQATATTELLQLVTHTSAQAFCPGHADRFGRAGMAYHFDNGGNIDVPYKASLNPTQCQ